MSSSVEKISMNLPSDMVRDAKAAARDRGDSFTYHVRRCISLEAMLADAVREGGKVEITHANGSTVQLMML